jgi:hypothetical protein
MRCPHCLVDFHDHWKLQPLANQSADSLHISGITYCQCSSCQRFVFRLASPGGTFHERVIWPKAPARATLPKIVDEKFAGDYREACLVLADSPKASAALSRRCLQMILREKAGIKPGSLNSEIDGILNSKSLGSNLAGAIDAVRVIGNFAAHPLKSTNTGEIIDVEPGEAEWLLDTLEKLFDFYFVEPDLLAKKRADIDLKLKDAGKPPLK